jgi:parvulin-like peptidyl-prolyl isomerase
VRRAGARKWLAATIVVPTVLNALAWVGCTCGRRREPERDRSERIEQADRARAAPLPGIAPEDATTVLAEIDDRTITVRDVAEELALQYGVTRLRALLPAQRAQLLEWLVRDELLADEARRRGYADLEEVVSVRREALVRRLVETLRHEIEVPEPTEPELRAAYDAEPQRWRIPELVRARILVLRDRATAEDVLEQLQVALLDSRDPIETFAQFTQRFGWHSPMLGDSETLGPFARPDEARPQDAHVPAPVADAAFATPTGQVHRSVVQHRNLFYLVMPIAREPPTDISFEQAREHLRRQLRERAFAERIEALAWESTDIHYFDDALALVREPSGD